MENSQILLIITAIICLFLLVACGKNEIEDEQAINNSSQISTESLQKPGGAEASNEIGSNGGGSSVTVTIRIDWDQVYIDDVKCDNLEDLKEKIIASKCTKIELLHNDAMKDMKDSVTELLNDIENILNIEVNYNDD
ncbi:MAG: hypothetical protein HFH91_00670 [Lachnospiraceae bacterium]|nr:hypothetical protein [Lachnospiraceae bacterium]